MKNVVFTGGGTGGHIFPGIAVAEVLLKNNDCKLTWIASSKGMDKSIIESAGLNFVPIPAGKLRRYFSFQNFIDVFKVFGGFVKSFFILLKLKPEFVFSKGGFVSVPPCAAAKLLRIPVITHECDFSPGLATRLNSRFAKNILVSYPETIQFLNATYRDKAFCTGNPVRMSFYSADAEKGRDFLQIKTKKILNLIDTNKHKPVLLVLGGSLGAKQLNDLVENSIEFLLENFIVVHQLGNKNIEQAEEIKKKIESINPELLENYKSFAFIKEEMASVLATSSIILARSGANTIWEAAATGKAMILVPLEKGSSRGDQIENAEFFQKAGAAEVLMGDSVNAENLEKILKEFIDDDEKLKAMSDASFALAKEKPAVIISDFLSKFLKEEK